jgi:FtsP/CotA-like multicopper oxidase with cupredoxin domain
LNIRINRRMLALICAVVAASGTLVVLGYAGVFQTAPFNGVTVHFTIIEDSSGLMKGMNGSFYYPLSTPWPVIVVNRGERVDIHIFNNSTSEPHGFSIIHYLPGGVTISPQQSANIQFIANDAGNFTMRCLIPCSIHEGMQNGRLVVAQ